MGSGELTLLSSDAQNIYWMSRYLERAGHISRLLETQFDLIHDRPASDVELGWRRIYRSLDRTPAGANLMPVQDDNFVMLLDAYTLVDDLAFEPGNPDAIIILLGKARENARQIRNILNHEIWSTLNVSFLDMKSKKLKDIWGGQPQDFFIASSVAVRTFCGIAEATMYRDHGWHFFKLGQYVERIQLTCALLDAHIALFPTNDHHWEIHWSDLLGICVARAAFRRLQSVECQPGKVLDFVIGDSRLTNSINYGLGEIQKRLEIISGSSDSGSKNTAAWHIGKTRALIEFDWPVHEKGDDTSIQNLLKQIRVGVLEIDNQINNTYFNYPIEYKSG